MGHRRYNAPRRGSLAYRPRGRASSVVPVMRTWPKVKEDKPLLEGFAGFKAGCLHVITVDDRERAPNFGKPLFPAATVLATPPMLVYGFRAYEGDGNGLRAVADVFVKELPKELARKSRIVPPPSDEATEKIRVHLERIKRFAV